MKWNYNEKSSRNSQMNDVIQNSPRRNVFSFCSDIMIINTVTEKSQRLQYDQRSH